jgi:hypothetical protein
MFISYLVQVENEPSRVGAYGDKGIAEFLKN